MKHWQDVLGHIRLLGPDIPVFREDVKFINDHIERLEAALQKVVVIGDDTRGWAGREAGAVARAALQDRQPVPIDKNWPGYEC